MTPEEFVNAVAEGSTPMADDDPEYCPRHGWQCVHMDYCRPNACEEEGDCCK
jgi:hypothetical protein